MSDMLSVPLPIGLKDEMRRHPEIKWVEVARKAIEEKIGILKRMDELLSKSTFTEEDALKHGRIVNKKVWAKTKKALR